MKRSNSSFTQSAAYCTSSRFFLFVAFVLLGLTPLGESVAVADDSASVSGAPRTRPSLPAIVISTAFHRQRRRAYLCGGAAAAPLALAQEQTMPNAAATLTRATVRHENRRLGYGGTLVLRGAPVGSVTIEGWQKSEVDVTAAIELRGSSEEELNRLAAVNNFLFASEPNQVSIITVGTHDRAYMKRAAKNFPKHLLNAAWRIDYRIRVPAFTNLEISNGRGAIKIEGVEGAIRLEALEADASLALAGGDVATIIQHGTLNVRILQRNWRGHGAEFNLANGELNAEFPPNFSGDINAEVLLGGKLENSFDALTPRDAEQNENSANTAENPRRLRARAGAGGPTLAFTVGNGTLRLRKAPVSEH